MRNVITKRIQLSCKEIEEALLNSAEFYKEVAPTHFGQMYMGAVMNRVYLRKLGQNLFEFSESCGNSGALEVIGTCKLTEVSSHMTELNLIFKYGNLNPEILKYVFWFFLTIGLATLCFGELIGLVFLIPSVFTFIIMTSKNSIKKAFMKKLAIVLNFENNWK